MFLMRTFEICSLNSFQICNKVLLTIVTILHITSPWLTYNWKFCTFWPPFTHFPLYPQFLSLATTQCVLCIYEHDFYFCIFFFQIPHLSEITWYLFSLISLSIISQSHPSCWKWQIFILFCGWIVLHCIQSVFLIECFLSFLSYTIYVDLCQSHFLRNDSWWFLVYLKVSQPWHWLTFWASDFFAEGVLCIAWCAESLASTHRWHCDSQTFPNVPWKGQNCPQLRTTAISWLCM